MQIGSDQEMEMKLGIAGERNLVVYITREQLDFYGHMINIKVILPLLKAYIRA